MKQVPAGGIVAKDSEHEYQLHHNKALYLAGFLDAHGDYLTKDEFDRKCSDIENRLGRPDVGYENCSMPVFLPKEAQRVS